jgi:hypothetical protein
MLREVMMTRQKKRPSTMMDPDTGMHWPGRLVTPEELAAWGYASVTEANVAIRAGRLRGPLIEGLTLVPFKNIPPSYKWEDDW